MKTIIFYSSTYNGNTLKIAESMAAVLSADLVSIESETSGIDLSKYDLIGDIKGKSCLFSSPCDNLFTGI